MNNYKHFLLSKRFWGIFFMSVSVGINYFCPDNESARLIADWLMDIGAPVAGIGVLMAKKPLLFNFFKKATPVLFLFLLCHDLKAQPKAANSGDSLISVDQCFFDITSRRLVFSNIGTGTGTNPEYIKQLGAPSINSNWFPQYALDSATVTNISRAGNSGKVGSVERVRYQYWTGLLTQSSSSAPVAIRLDSNTTKGIIFTRDSAGYYSVNSSDSTLFTAGKTWFTTLPFQTSYGNVWQSGTKLRINSGSDGVLDSTSFEIRIYP